MESPRTLIGRLVCVGIRGATPGESEYEADIDRCIEACAGGVVLFDVDVGEYRRRLASGADVAAARGAAPRNIRSPRQLVELTRELRRRLGARLIIGVDQEGGRVARLNAFRGFADSPAAVDFARLSAAEQSKIASDQAAMLSTCGINLNFAPCVDVAVNPDGPIIARPGRSFGHDPEMVVACATRVIEAHRAHGVATSIKHFPGHGSAGADSHFELPDITATYDESRELDVFRRLICDARPQAVMAGHLLHRGYDPDWPASLSRRTLTSLLRERLGFEGVIITDSLDMDAVARRVTLNEIVIRALNAGVDMVLYGYNPADAHAACPAVEIVEAIERGVHDNRIVGGLDRIRASATRIDCLIAGASHARTTATPSL